MKKSIILSALLAGSALVGVGVVAVAQDGPSMHHKGGDHGPMGFGPGGPGGFDGPRLEDLDADSDGNITKAEIDAHENAQFSEMDANNDGSISPAEMTSFGDMKREEMRLKMEAKRQEFMLARLDTDKNGLISRAEFTSKPNPMFEKVDANGDGVIDEAERTAAREQMGDRMGKEGKHRDGGFRPE